MRALLRARDPAKAEQAYEVAMQAAERLTKEWAASEATAGGIAQAALHEKTLCSLTLELSGRCRDEV